MLMQMASTRIAPELLTAFSKPHLLVTPLMLQSLLIYVNMDADPALSLLFYLMRLAYGMLKKHVMLSHSKRMFSLRMLMHLRSFLHKLLERLLRQELLNLAEKLRFNFLSSFHDILMLNQFLGN